MSGWRAVSRFLRRRWDTLLLALAGVALLVAASSLSRIAASVPRTVIVITLALVVAQLALPVRSRPRTAKDTSQDAIAMVRPDEIDVPREAVTPPSTLATAPAIAILWVLGMFVAMASLGSTLGAAFFSLAYLRWHARETWLVSVAYAVFFGASVQLLFGALGAGMWRPVGFALTN